MYCCMHTIGTVKTLYIAPSKFGLGVYTTNAIKKETVLTNILGPHLQFTDTKLLQEAESHCIQIDINKYIQLQQPYCYINHACNPNCGINAMLQIVTLENIAAGSELFFDYSTTMLERSWTMYCNCGAATCRKLIGDFDVLPTELQEKYKALQIVQPFIIKAI